MNLELYLQNSNTGIVYDISDIAQTVTVETYLDGEAGKLTCTLEKDPNNLLQIANGSIVSFIVDKKGFFFGYVFKISTDSSQNYKITAYNQLRYLKNTEVMATSNMTASDIFAKICRDTGLQYEVKVPTNYVPEPYLHSDKTLYTIIKRGKDLASINDRAQYFIRDDFGTLVWSELSYEKTNIQLGDNSILSSYNLEKSIDSDVYNQVKFYRDNKETGKRDTWIVKDSSNINKWGLLQYLKKADDDSNEAKIRETAENYLKVKNREVKTLKLHADVGIKELDVGKGIKFVLPREGIDEWMWIKTITHTFTKNSHTMDMEVSI
jgi:hypothetical protein